MNRISRHISVKDLRKTHQRQIGEQKEYAAQKLKEWQEAESERKQIEEAAKPYKSNWRDEIDLQESDWSPIAGSGPTNSASQSFSYSTPNSETGQPNTVTVSGLGGVESVPSTTTIDAGFGDISSVDAPNYSQLALQGYAPLLQIQKRGNQTEDERIDSEIRKLEAQIKESKAKETAAIDAWNAELLATMNRHGREWEAVLKKDGVYNPEKHKGLQARHDAEIEAIWSKEPKTEPYETERQNLRAKIAKLEKQRPINQQLDASQQVAQTKNTDVFMGARVQPSPALRDYRNTSPVSGTAMGANLRTAKKIMIDYLTKDWDNRVVADNEYLGRDYIDNQFFKNVIFDNDKTVVGGADAVVGTGQPPRVDPKTGEIVVRANFDFNKNEYEASGDPEKQEFAQRLKRFGGMSDYALDAIVDGLPGNLGTLAGMAISPFVAGSKSIGRGNNIPIVIRFTPQELKRKNKKQYDQLVRMGLIKESTWSKLKKHR